MKELINVVFDGNYLLHKTFSVIKNYNPQAETVEELFKDTKLKGVFLRKMIIDACAALNKIKVPIDKVIFVFDSHSWRYNIHPDYKHKLSKVRNDDYTQVFEVMETLITKLTKRGFIVSRVDGMEGDDLLYFWSTYFEMIKEDTLLVTGDGDMIQLVSKRISVFNNNSKNLNLFVIEPTDLIDSPDTKINIVDAKKLAIKKILLGDSGDNVPSLKKGFGEKTFEKFMEGFVEVDFRTVRKMAEDLNRYFKVFTKSEEDFTDKIVLNIRLVYLNHIIYEDETIENMIEHIQEQKYTYDDEFTLECIFGMVMK